MELLEAELPGRVQRREPQAQRWPRQVKIPVQIHFAVYVEPLHAELFGTDKVGAGDASIEVEFAAAQDIAAHLEAQPQPAGRQMARYDELGIVASGEPGLAVVARVADELVPGDG